MQMEIAVSADQEEKIERSDIKKELQETANSYPEVNLEIREQAKGAFPPTGDPVSLVITANASVQLLGYVYPKLKDKISGTSAETEIRNLENLAIEYLEQHTRVEADYLSRVDKEISGNYRIFVFEYSEDGSEHYIKINENDISDWTYKEV